MEDLKRSKTIGEFCFAQRFSKSFYYELKRRGLNPDELEVLGVKRITATAEEAWLARMAERAKSEAAQIEAERRRKHATIAGRIAAESPLHVSRRRAGLLGKRQPRRPV
jgi:hypothetical protein